MALGGTPMSSSTISPAPTATSGDSNVMGQRGANYFFGFLITFVVLFLVFVGCGIGSRRRLLAERREALLMGDAWSLSKSDAEQKRPEFYEYALGVPVQVDQWEYITVSTPRMCLKHLNLGSTNLSFFSFGLVSFDLLCFFCSHYLQCWRVHRKSLRTRNLAMIRGRILPHTPISKLLVVGPRHPTPSFPDLLSHNGDQREVTTKCLQTRTKKSTRSSLKS